LTDKRRSTIKNLKVENIDNKIQEKPKYEEDDQVIVLRRRKKAVTKNKYVKPETKQIQ
jgi:hypothetical protein